MMKLLVLLPLLLSACKTRVNTLVCCTDEADCMAHDLPVGTDCDPGLLCRGNQCIAEACESAADCEASAPYCVLEDNRCEESCTADAQCPGFGQDQTQRFCINGDCVQCRDGMNDCPANTPVCQNNVCRGCLAHTECASGACAADGTCVDETQIAYVEPNGAAQSDCSKLAPCSLARALAVTPVRPYILLASGDYQNAGTLTLLNEHRSVIGTGPTRPTIRNSAQGDVIKIDGVSEVTLENLEITGASGGSSAHGVECAPALGNALMHLIDDTITQNTGNGVNIVHCAFSILRGTFSGNFEGVYAQDSMGTVDRCNVAGNQRFGVDLDGGTFQITNSFVVRNGGGINIFPDVGSQLEFNTIADNTSPTLAGVSCSFSSTSPQMTYPNNILVRNALPTNGMKCTFPNSIISNDISNLQFKSPDVAPFDYHIGPGSIAIDAAALSTMDHDFDGDPRPLGGGRDIGADEAQ